MSVHQQIFALQRAQLRHDEKYHRDILLLTVGDRMKHFALHFSKYVGYLVESIDQGDIDRYEKVLTDAFIINLASANTLNIDLGRAIAERRKPMPESLLVLGKIIAHEISRPEDDRIWLIKRLARFTAKLAKACESLDHVESYPFRTVMEESVLSLFELVVSEAACNQFDLETLSKSRLDSVERKSIFRNCES